MDDESLPSSSKRPYKKRRISTQVEAAPIKEAKLPFILILNILLRLTVKCLLRFKQVQRFWQTEISSSSFAEQHLVRSTEEKKFSLLFKHRGDLYDLHYPLEASSPCMALQLNGFPFQVPDSSVMVHGSCNGLLCVSVNTEHVFLFNPSLRWYKQLPDASNQYVGSSFGFGYSPFTKAYKIVQLVHYPPYLSEVNVYMVGTDSWRTIIGDPGDVYAISSCVTLKGMLHWIARHSEKVYSDVILIFDLENETFWEVPLPEFEHFQYKVIFLGVVNGLLCVFCKDDKEHVEIWIMKNYGRAESWYRLYSSRYEPTDRSLSLRNCKPLKFLQNGKILLGKGNGTMSMYDIETGSSKNIIVHGIPQSFEVVDYVESLVSIKDKE